MSYLLAFDVSAETRLAAITEATARLRTGLKLNGVHKAEETAPGLWHVVLHVWEDA
jgi:hypothetical protein